MFYRILLWKNMKFKIFLIATFLLILKDSIKAEPTLHRGEIEHAKFTVAVPETWNGKLLMIAPGYRDEKFIQIDDTNGFRVMQRKSPLEPYLNLKDKAYDKLLQQGWMLATTSYRRNGLVLDDGMLDMDNLIDYLSQTYGKAKRVIVEGFSMGAMIATYLAEREDRSQRYGGFVAVAFMAPFPNCRQVRFKPMKPILFLSNQTELVDPVLYCLRSPKGNLAPAFWGIMRNGHGNILAEERLEAIYAMDRWIESGEISRFCNATQILNMKSVAEFKGARAYAKVATLHPLYGNLITEFIEKDMEKLGIDLREHFVLGIGDKIFYPLYGTKYSDVSIGQWVAFIMRGNLIIARNYENVAKTTVCVPGDTIWISKIK